MEIKKSFNKLSLTYKVIISIIIAIVVFYAVIKIINFIKVYQKNDEIKTEQSKLKKEGMTLSFAPSQYLIMADVIFNSGQNEVGTNEQAIFNQLLMLKNDLDFLELQKAYGVREYGLFMSANFVEHLYNELTEDEIKTVNAILATGNITYRI